MVDFLKKTQIRQAGCSVILIISQMLTACATQEAASGKPVPQQNDRVSLSQFAKTDLDRLTDVEMRENTESLRLLMTKLYKRNPAELRKSTVDSVEDMVTWVFDGHAQHGWKFAGINYAQDTAAIHLAFAPNYKGDRVLPFIVGLQTMLIKAHGGKTEFFLLDSIDPQKLYNVARNVEIAAWKLSNARNTNGQLYLLTNEMNEKERNLTFEREFGKIIGRTDLYAITLAEKSQRMISRVVQNLATALFLPF